MSDLHKNYTTFLTNAAMSFPAELRADFYQYIEGEEPSNELVKFIANDAKSQQKVIKALRSEDEVIKIVLQYKANEMQKALTDDEVCARFTGDFTNIEELREMITNHFYGELLNEREPMETRHP